jgi:glycine betaine/proline transport system ATP-binding protein
VFTGRSVVADAHALDLAKDTPASALERMARLDRNALHVLDDGRLAGIVTYRALAERGTGNGAGLAGAMIREVPTAPLDAHLYRLYGLCAGGLPVALLDEDGCLAGVAEPQAVFAQIAVGEAAAPGSQAIPPAR